MLDSACKLTGHHLKANAFLTDFVPRECTCIACPGIMPPKYHALNALDYQKMNVLCVPRIYRICKMPFSQLRNHPTLVA
jgi:hypothetical protein